MRTLALAVVLLMGACGFDGVPTGGGPDVAAQPDMRTESGAADLCVWLCWAPPPDAGTDAWVCSCVTTD